MSDAAAVRPPWWVRPGIVLPAVTGLAFLAALFTPVQGGPRDGDPRLSTYSTSPLGARLFHDLTQRLGWRAERLLRPGLPSPDRHAVVALLNPAIPLRTAETHALLEYVRAGGGALVVLGSTTQALLDSLHLTIAQGGRAVPVEASETCEDEGPLKRASLWFGGNATMYTFRWTAPAPDGVEWMLGSRVGVGKDGTRVDATMLGFPLGAGRIVVSADADLLRNDAMRDCDYGFDVAAIRALEYLRGGGPTPRTLVVFDEYHQAHGAHPGTVSAAVYYLGTSPSGRLLAQLALAGLVLLVALGPRIVPPSVETRIERRSPLEQVDALARAYGQVGATRTAAERLVHALRRRVEHHRTRGRNALTDEAWLAAIASRVPALADDVALARRAIAETIPPRSFATLGPALHRIEATLTHT